MGEVYFRLKLPDGRTGTLAHHSNVKETVLDIRKIIEKDPKELPEKEREFFRDLQWKMMNATIEFCEVSEPTFEVKISDYEFEEEEEKEND